METVIYHFKAEAKKMELEIEWLYKQEKRIMEHKKIKKLDCEFAEVKRKRY